MLELGKVKQANCLEVKIGEGVYHVPSAKNMPVTKAKRLRAILNDKSGDEPEGAQIDFFFDYFGQYLGDALDLLDMEDFLTLIAEWSALNEDEGVGLGE